MKLAKSFLKPFRPTRDGGAVISLSFFSRRLRSNGGQAHFFSKKRGPTLESHEPSSPKVTCIGQVRVKSKRSGKKSRKKKKINGEVSFRKIEQSSVSGSQECRNQRWVLLPISVCEALRGFGAEFSCLFPCKSSCFRRGKKRKNENGCGVLFPRWLVAVESGAGRRREIEVVVGGVEAAEETPERRPSIRSSRRHVFEDIEFKDDGIEEDVEEARVSICIPPKNALLLMRCRSDPMKMASSISNHRFSWDGNAASRYENDEENIMDFAERQKKVEVFEQETKNEEELVTKSEENEQEQEQEEVESNMSSFEALLDQENADDCQDCPVQEKEKVLHPSLSPPSAQGLEGKIQKEQQEQEAGESKTLQEEKTEESKTQQEDEQNSVPQTELESMSPKNQEPKKDNESPLLPECLLLMMCEPKLSMEVSKETWVRGADFIRWLPERPRKGAKAAKTGGCDHEPVKKKPNVEPKAKPSIPPLPARKNDFQPPRSSCSLPAASRAAGVEGKLVNGGGKEPFGLTRCKSEPMRTAAAKLMAESCGMKMESQNRGAVDVGSGAAELAIK